MRPRIEAWEMFHVWKKENIHENTDWGQVVFEGIPTGLKLFCQPPTTTTTTTTKEQCGPTLMP